VIPIPGVRALYCLVNVTRSSSVGSSVTVPMHPAENVRVTSAVIVVALTGAAADPVTVQSGASGMLPAGNMDVSVTCEPETVPLIVP
jgi:hypothetical protein